MSGFEFVFSLFALLLGSSLVEVTGFVRTVKARRVRLGWLKAAARRVRDGPPDLVVARRLRSRAASGGLRGRGERRRLGCGCGRIGEDKPRTGLL